MNSLSTKNPKSNNSDITVSVVIAARNEENKIAELINALEKQNYPAEFTEIIIVDDCSADNTSNIVCSYADQNPNIKLICANNKVLPGKKGALSIGIQQAVNPYILITDADCIPETDWVKLFAAQFAKGFDLLFGVAPFIQSNSFINKIACFENLRTSVLTFGLASLGMPYSAAARSFGFRKEAFNKIGGYQNTLETLSGDDDLLIREAVKHNLKIGIVTEDNSKVFSETKVTFKDYLLQKARHTSTANHYLWKHKITLGIWHLGNLLFLCSPVLVNTSKIFWFPFLIKISTDILIVRKYQERFGQKFNVRETILLQIIYEIMLIINYLLSFFRRNKW